MAFATCLDAALRAILCATRFCMCVCVLQEACTQLASLDSSLSAWQAASDNCAAAVQHLGAAQLEPAAGRNSAQALLLLLTRCATGARAG